MFQAEHIVVFREIEGSQHRKENKMKVTVLDTTLRDGEQSPGAALSPNEKLRIAKQLEILGVDKIEAGFPASSSADFKAVKAISREVKTAAIVAFARAKQDDILCAWDAVEAADEPTIHTFIATSDIHISDKLRSTREKVLERAKDAVALARSLCNNVEFSAEDSMRTDREYLCEVISAVIKAGANTVNITDTVGIATPWEIDEIFHFVQKEVPETRTITLSIHCHDDLGLAVANSLAAIKAGANQVECTINGLGERAGNAALEEIVMALSVKENFFGKTTGINTQEICATSNLVSRLTGFPVQRNKAIVGQNAFAHEAGIHQHGMLRNQKTYEIIDPRTVGAKGMLFMGRHSGKHGLARKIAELGHSVNDDELEQIYSGFLKIAEDKKRVTDKEIETLIKSLL